MPLSKGYGYDTVQSNIEKMIDEGYTREQAVAASMAKARVSFFERFPNGALAPWLAFPRRYRMREHYTRNGAPRHIGTLENPSSRAELSELRKAARLGQAFTGHRYNQIAKFRRQPARGARLAIGPVTGIIYLAKRDGKLEQYHHAFAQDSRPLLVATSDGKRLELLGGAFRFTDRGIVDQPVKVKRKR